MSAKKHFPKGHPPLSFPVPRVSIPSQLGTPSPSIKFDYSTWMESFETRCCYELDSGFRLPRVLHGFRVSLLLAACGCTNLSLLDHLSKRFEAFRPQSVCR